jgi:hypothetical protein
MSSVFIMLKDATTAPQTSQIVEFANNSRTVQATIAGTGAVSATIDWYGTNTRSTVDGIKIATTTLSETTSDRSGAEITANWNFMYCTLTAISGTGATVNANIGC